MVLLALGAAFITYTSPVDRSLSDSRNSLLVSQQIVEHGTVTLDEFDADEPIRDRFVVRRDDHTYYYFPLGSSVLATPAVLVAGWFGLDMADQTDEAWLQNLLSSAVGGFVLVLAFLLARSFTGRWAALTIAGVSVYGSALVSSLGTALWSLDLAVLLELVALVLIVRHRPPRVDDEDPDAAFHTGTRLSTGGAVGVGLCLFAAFAVRPSAAPFIVAMLGYLLITDRRRAFVVAATAAGSLLVWTLVLRLATGVAVDAASTLLVSPEAMAIRIMLLGIGMSAIAGGIGVVVHSGLTGGPFELLMMVGEDHGLDRTRVRIGLEVTTLVVGILAGGRFGLGTVIFALSIGRAMALLMQAMENALREADNARHVACLLTQVEVDPDDPAFDDPSKPVGPFFSEEEAKKVGLELDARGNVKTDGAKMTSESGVFAAGDMARGQSLVVWAIAEGRQAAHGIDAFLMGETSLPSVKLVGWA